MPWKVMKRITPASDAWREEGVFIGAIANAAAKLGETWGAGEYRLNIALRAENAEHNAVVKWFEVRYDGTSVELSEVEGGGDQEN